MFGLMKYTLVLVTLFASSLAFVGCTQTQKGATTGAAAGAAIGALAGGRNNRGGGALIGGAVGGVAGAAIGSGQDKKREQQYYGPGY